MTERELPNRPSDPHAGHISDRHAGVASRGGHSWTMIACCIPMLLIAVVLVVTGVVGVGFLFVAVVCTAMMALMMGFGDHRGHGAG